MENKHYMAIGEEATRGTAESTTVGFVPLMSPSVPAVEFDDKARAEHRGEETALGARAIERLTRRWGGSLEMPVFTEAGTTKGIVGTLLKHFFGKSASAQNGATGQYYHMMYPVADPFATANLGTKALTLNCNIQEGATPKNWPFTGGRVKSLSFEQVAGEKLKLAVEMMGQSRDASGTAIASPTYPAENLRCDFNNCTVYYGGTPTRTGSAPAYTEIGAGTATALKPDKVSFKLERGMEDMLRLAGVDYPDKTRIGQVKGTLELTIDWEDPASGFSSVDDVLAWYAGVSETNFMLIWNTGTQAGTGDNHGIIVDLPRCNRMGGAPELSDKDPLITLKYECLFDATTTQYLAGLMLKNTASAV